MSVPLPPAGDSDWFDWASQTDDLARGAAQETDLAAVATSGSATDLSAGTLNDARIPSTITRDSELTAHSGSTSNPHAVTKAQVGLGSVDNTADTAKPVSTTQQAALDAKVSTTLRGPIGGISAATFSASTFTLPITHLHLRWTLNGNVTVSVPGAGTDGQTIRIEALANSGTRIVTFAAGFETSQAVPARAFTIPSGTWGYFAVIYRSGTWRLTYAEPQTGTTTFSINSAWTPVDHGLLAWTCDPALLDATVSNGTGYLTGSAVKLDTAATVSNVVYQITAAGSGFTAGRNLLGVYDGTGALVASTPDKAGVWNSANIKTSPLTTPVALAAGVYYVAFICTATAAPTFLARDTFGGIINLGRTATSCRNFQVTTAYTALPSTMPSVSDWGDMVWFGLS